MLTFSLIMLNDISEFCQKIVLRSEEHTSELQSRSDLVCRLLLEKKKLTFSAVEKALAAPPTKGRTGKLILPDLRARTRTITHCCVCGSSPAEHVPNPPHT